MKMTTHRHIQVHIALDDLESKVRVWQRCAINLRGIGNHKGATYYSHRALRASVVICKLKKRLSQSI